MKRRTAASMPDLYSLFARPALRFVSAERGHQLAIAALKAGVVPADHTPDDSILATRVFGLDFPNPVGLAAGFDKDAEVLHECLALGFGFVEAGTVTPKSQPGNPRPRAFRLDEDEAVINRYGFNSGGLDAFVARLKARRAGGARGLVGANVGKNKDTADAAVDYVRGIEAVAPHADYIVINISSPNTPGLRDLQTRDEMERLLTSVMEARSHAMHNPPLLVKVAPDLGETEIEAIAEVARAARVDGLIVGNTTLARPPNLRSPHRNETGGLSGRPLMELSTSCLAAFFRATQGRMHLVGCGGISSGADAYRKIRAGASLVQLYTAMVFQGPGIVGRIKRELADLLRADGFKSITEAVGADHR